LTFSEIIPSCTEVYVYIKSIPAFQFITERSVSRHWGSQCCQNKSPSSPTLIRHTEKINASAYGDNLNKSQISACLLNVYIVDHYSIYTFITAAITIIL